MQPIQRCRSCGAAIRWYTHPTSQKPAPIDAAPVADGNIILYADGAYHVLHKGEVPPFGVARYTNHFLTCKDAKKWSARRG